MVTAMYDFKEFYDVGEELSQKEDESHIRSAINRDYYALFGESRKYLVEVRKKEYLKSKLGIHTKVCDTLRYSKDITEKYIGDILYNLIEIRGFADYDWKSKDCEYFQKILPGLKEDVKKGLESLEYLKNKYNKK